MLKVPKHRTARKPGIREGVRPGPEKVVSWRVEQGFELGGGATDPGGGNMQTAKSGKNLGHLSGGDALDMLLQDGGGSARSVGE